jgi:hypothetical protein
VALIMTASAPNKINEVHAFCERRRLIERIALIDTMASYNMQCINSNTSGALPLPVPLPSPGIAW